MLVGTLLFSLAQKSNAIEIKFDSNGGSYCKVIKFKKDKLAFLPSPTREGYLFCGWFEDEGVWQNELNNENLKDYDKDVTVYAKWIKKVKLVFIDADYEDIFLDDLDITLPIPEREGYEFVGWYTDLNYTKAYDTREAVQENEFNEVYLYAKWRVSSSKEKTIYYFSSDVTVGFKSQMAKVEPNGEITLLKPDIPYYEFCGWYFDKELTRPAPMKMKNEFLEYEITTLYGDFKEKKIKEAVVVGSPKLVYEYGEEFDCQDAKIRLEFEDSKYESIFIDITSDMVQGFKSVDSSIYIFDEENGYKSTFNFRVIYNMTTLAETESFEYFVKTDLKEVSLSEDNLTFKLNESASLVSKFISINWTKINGESGSELIVKNNYSASENYYISFIDTSEVGTFVGRIRYHFKYFTFYYTVLP